MPELEANFLAVLRDHTAGDPMRDDARWTNLTLREIADRLAQAGTPVSVTVVKQLLRKHNYVKRKAPKRQAMGQHPDRNAQFENIAELQQAYEASGNPILSIDTKKKEALGNFYREGQLYTQAPLHTLDHDFGSAGLGVVVPHGLYDVIRNRGHVNLGVSHDTSAFACDSIYQWWQRYGKSAWPDATSILLLCDGGGSNSASQYLFKEDLQKLADKIGIEIRVAHYPPYASKYNPIEHRLFPHLTRACQGVIFHSVEIVRDLMKRAQTQTGLKVTVNIIKKIYDTGRKVSEGFKDQMKILFDEYLPKWNYTAIPANP
jgi:hypothetical protein